MGAIWIVVIVWADYGSTDVEEFTDEAKARERFEEATKSKPKRAYMAPARSEYHGPEVHE